MARAPWFEGDHGVVSPFGALSDAREGAMVTLDDEAKAREALADRGGRVNA